MKSKLLNSYVYWVLLFGLLFAVGSSKPATHSLLGDSGLLGDMDAGINILLGGFQNGIWTRINFDLYLHMAPSLLVILILHNL